MTKASLKPIAKPPVRIHSLEVVLTNGPVSEKFADKNPMVSRTIQIRGDQTLEELHEAIFHAFGRYDEHLYEFQFGQRPMDRRGNRYVAPGVGDEDPDAFPADETTIDSLELKTRKRFFYWFDFGDDWMHQIVVKAIEPGTARGKYPKLIAKVGKNPPQYDGEQW